MGDKSSTSLQDEITLIPSPENHAELATPNEHTVAVPSPQDGINEATLLVENDEGESFQEGDQKIRDLEAENKRLKTTLSQKTLEYDELVQELERHIELVETLRAKLSSYESRRREQPSSAAKVLQRRKPVPIHNNTVGRTPTSKSSGRAISHAKGLSAKQPLNAAAAARTEDLQPHAISTNSDDICAALSCFVEENKMNLLGLGNFGHADGGVSRLINSQAHLENTLEQLSKFVTDGDYTTLEQTSDNGQEMSVPKHASGKPHRGKQDQQANLFSFLLENSGGGSSGGNLVRDDDDYFADDFDEEYQLGSDPFYAQSKKSASSRARSVHALSHLFQPTVMKPLSEEETKIIDLMQARMARNVASLGTRPLNTMEIAKQCKRLMVAYNIGQRLFAKAVMREVVKSQGSLSELLSKPRAWHKLTDKGREAFRRIYGWLSDDTAIELLCSLSPRRISMPCDKIEHPTSDSLIELRDEGDGMDGVLLGEYSGEPSSNAASDEHLDSIINSTIDKVRMSSMAVKQVKAEIEGREVTSGETPFSSVPAILVTMSGGAIPITTTKSSSSHPPSSSSSSRWRHDDIPREKIIDIYEAEKAKLESQELCVDIGGGSSSVPPKRSNSTSSKRGGSVESAVAQPVVPVPQPKQQHHFTRSSTQVLVSPLPASGELESGVICGRFPAKQTKEPTPILQEQLEKYPQLDTEEVVKQIKDWLSDTSTSQRQFGESVLGLSQGSVSDLLARPKPWNQLTHKGREPFIRMKMFLEDNVHSGILLGENTSERGEDSSREVSQPSGVDPTGSEVVGQQGCDMLSKVKDEPLSEISLLAEEEAQEEGFYVDDDDINDDDEVQGNGHDRASPRCGEETLDTAELAKKIKMYLADTGISQRAFGEHVLHTNSGTTSELLCRPKAWTEASSELRLPEKSRDAYTRMRNFLEDAAAKQALKAGNAKSLRALFPSTISTSISPNNHSTFGNAIADVANSMTVKEMLTSGLFGGGKKTIRVIPPTKQSALQPTQALDTTPMPLKRKALEDDPTPLTQAYEQQDYVTSGGPVKKMPRFQRTIITDKQKEALLYVYLHEQRPTTKTIDQIAVALGLSSRTVTNWFHNFRTRQKAKELKLMSEGLEPPKLPTISATAEALEGELWFLDIVEILARNRRLENDGGNGGEAIDDLFPTMMPTEQGSPKLELALDTSGESETTAEDASIVSSKSSRQSQGQSRNGGMMNGGRSQLDRAIARMHDRLSSGAA